MAAAVAETRRGSPARGRGEGAAPVRGAPERAQGCGGHSEGRGRGLALLPVVPQLFPVLSRRVDVAGALQPAGGRERRSAGHCTGTAAVAPVCGGVPVLPRGTRAVVPVSLQDLRVVVLLPARGERLNGARGQPCPSPWQPSTQFSPGQHPPPPTPIQPLLPETPDPVNEQHDEDNEEEDDDGREANEPRLQHLGAHACMARGQAREKTGMETASGELHPPGNGAPPAMGWDIGRHSLFPLPRVPWVPRKPLLTQLTRPQASGEHWGSRWVSPDLSALPPKVTVGALGQTGPTGKVSQELI